MDRQRICSVTPGSSSLKTGADASSKLVGQKPWAEGRRHNTHRKGQVKSNEGYWRRPSTTSSMDVREVYCLQAFSVHAPALEALELVLNRFIADGRPAMTSVRPHAGPRRKAQRSTMDRSRLIAMPPMPRLASRICKLPCHSPHSPSRSFRHPIHSE